MFGFLGGFRTTKMHVESINLDLVLSFFFLV